VGSKSLEEHAWVRAEINAGHAAGEAAGVERMFVVHAGTEQHVPSWLAGHPIGLRYDFDALSENAVQKFAARLRNLNRVTVDTISPPFEALMRRAREVRASLKDQPLDPDRWDTMDQLEILQECTAVALALVAGFRSAEEVDHQTVSKVLYQVRLESDPLWPPPEEPVHGAGGFAAQRLADDLGLLASLPTLDTDTRGFAYQALANVARAGVTHAFDVLRTCLRWEWADALIVIVADTLASYPEHRDRDEAVLTLLKSETLHDSWPLDLLGEDDGGVRLRHQVRRLTAHEISALVLVKRCQELTTRMKQAIQTLNITGVELVFREAIPVSGIAHSSSNYYRMDPNAPDNARQMLPKLVSKCAREWPPEHRAKLWLLPFEILVFGPLNALHHTYGESCGASEAMTAFVSALEAPISEHEALLVDVPEAARMQPTVQLALKELGVRRYTIRKLRDEAIVIQDGEELNIAVYPAGAFLTRGEKLRRLRARAQSWSNQSSEATQSEAVQMPLDTARRVAATWNDMPFC
jgi:hypothetical protein